MQSYIPSLDHRSNRPTWYSHVINNILRHYVDTTSRAYAVLEKKVFTEP